MEESTNNLFFVLVTPSAADCQVLTASLAQLGIPPGTITQAVSFEQGMQAVGTTPRSIAILALDPAEKLNREAVAQFRAIHTRVPLIVLADADQEALARDCLNAGAQEFISREDVQPAFLQRAIRHALDRKKLEDELQRHRDNLEAIVAQRMTELGAVNEQLREEVNERREAERLKDDFVSIVSHELRTPLSVIKEAVHLLSDEIPGPLTENQVKVLAVARSNADRLGRLIDDLLDIAKIESGKMELQWQHIDFRGLINQLSASMAPSAQAKGLEFRVDSVATDLPVMVDPDRLMEVLMNLVGNAIKFTHTGRIQIQVQPVDGEIWCSIEDTGEGIASGDIPKLFQKFVQVGGHNAEHSSGTGLGLCIAQNIIRLHDGRMWVESELGKGSRFSFSLPLHVDRNPAEERGNA